MKTNKIFDEDVEKYLLNSGVSKKQVAGIKHKEFKKGMLEIAKKLVVAITNEDESILKDYLGFSPAGDGYGCDNSLLDFSSIQDSESKEVMDIQDAFSYLKGLANEFR